MVLQRKKPVLRDWTKTVGSDAVQRTSAHISGLLKKNKESRVVVRSRSWGLHVRAASARTLRSEYPFCELVYHKLAKKLLPRLPEALSGLT